MVRSLFTNPEVTVTPTAGAYTANDVVGGLHTISLADEGAVINGGILNQIIITDSADQGESLTVVLFRDEPSTIADKDPYAPTLADSRKRLATFLVSSWTDRTSHQEAEIEQINITVGTGDLNVLYMYVVAVGTPTFGVDPLYFTFDGLSEG